MAEQSNYRLALDAQTVSGITHKSVPVQTITGGTNWAYDTTGDNVYCEISVRSQTAAAIKTDGTLWLWGNADQGKLGDGTIVNKSSPVQTIAGGNNWKQVSVGHDFVAAIKTDGTLWTWGNAADGSLGNNQNSTDRSSPGQTIAGGNNWKQVAAGYCHVAAIKTDGTLWLWGDNAAGALGTGATVNRSSPVQTVAGGNDWKQVAAGITNTAAIKCDGTLWTWGCNFAGALGTGTTSDRSSPGQTILGGNDWKQVAISGGPIQGTHTAAIKTDGTLWVWGSDNDGRLGNGSTASAGVLSPIQTLAGGTNWKHVQAGTRNTAAVKNDGTLWIWGSNTYGQLGNSCRCDVSSPIQTSRATSDWCQIALDESAIAIKCNGTLWTWGNNSLGELGINCITANDCVTYNTDFDSVFVRKDIFSEGGLWGWGNGACGNLGNNSTTNRSSPVQTVAGGTNWKQLSVGTTHAAVIKTDGTLWLWGNNSYGRLGNNSTANVSSPIQTVAGGTNWKQVVAGICHTAAIKTDGTLWLWGAGRAGRIGDNVEVDRSSPVQTVAGGTNWKQVAAGFSHTAAIKTDGTLWLWGCNEGGNLGNNSAFDGSSPIQTISGGTNWKQVSSGCCITAAIKNDGTLWLWGYGTYGALGNNSTAFRSSPVQTVSGGTNWKQVDVCKNAAAIKIDGTLWLWGDGTRGSLGTSVTKCISSPIQTIAGGTNWKKVSTGDFTVGAIKTDGTLWMWGNNFSGTLGNNSRTDSSSPIQTVAGGTDWKEVSVGSNFTLGIRDSCW